MNKSWFWGATVGAVLVGAVFSVLGLGESVELVGAAMVAVGAYFGFSAAEPASKVSIGGKPALRLSLSSKRLSMIAALTVSGTVLWGFAGVFSFGEWG